MALGTSTNYTESEADFVPQQWYSRKARSLCVATPTDFYSSNILLEISAIALKGISVGMHFTKENSVLRKARVCRLLGSTMNYTQQGSYHCILKELTYFSQHQSRDVCDHIAVLHMKNKILAPYYLVFCAEDKPVNRFL